MKKITAAFAAFALASGVAWAGDATPAAKDAVEIKFGAKVGDVLRFRETESSSTEAGGKARSGEEISQEYAATVKALRPDGGVDVEVSFEKVHNKILNPATGTWMEIDTSKPLPEGADMQAKMVDMIARAMVGHAFTVTLDAHGAATAVTGLREAIKAGVKGNPMESMFPVDQAFGDEICMKLAVSLFAAAPAAPHAVASKWTENVKAEVSSQDLEFAVESTLSAATPDDATVASKYTWAPGAKATADGAKAAGGGDCTSKFSRKVGFVLSMKRHLEANRDTAATKATSHTDVAIERLAPAAAKPADTPPAKK
jgi:hypothetical protein